MRGLDSPVNFLKNTMIQLCCAPEVTEKFLGTAAVWQEANGPMPYERAKKEANLYTVRARYRPRSRATRARAPLARVAPPMPRYYPHTPPSLMGSAGAPAARLRRLQST